MEDKLIEVLELLGYPVKKQGSILPDEPYPDSFFTFWNDTTDGASFYDNNERYIRWEYSVNFYSADPSIVLEKLLTAKEALNNNGFKVTGAGYDVMSDELTHTGRGISVLYMQKI